MPLISVIIPVYNSERTIIPCLEGIGRSSYPHYEIIVVDDASRDRSVELARTYSSHIYPMETNQGANQARNFGARQAQGDILVFIDSDIVVQEDTLTRIADKLNQADSPALVGVYTGSNRSQNLITRYKNNWIRFSYILYSGKIDWMFGSISAIRKTTFDRTGGFRAQLAAKDGIDDIEFGKRLVEAGIVIELDSNLEVTHLKEFTLFSLLKNEFYRSQGFAQLAAELGQTGKSMSRGFANIYPEFILGTLYGFIMILSSLMTLIWKWPGIVYLWILFGGYLLLNGRFLCYLIRQGQIDLCMLSPFLLLLDQLFCLIGGGWGTLTALKNRLKSH